MANRGNDDTEPAHPSSLAWADPGSIPSGGWISSLGLATRDSPSEQYLGLQSLCGFGQFSGRFGSVLFEFIDQLLLLLEAASLLIRMLHPLNSTSLISDFRWPSTPRRSHVLRKPFSPRTKRRSGRLKRIFLLMTNAIC